MSHINSKTLRVYKALAGDVNREMPLATDGTAQKHRCPLAQRTGAHCSTVSQWDRSKHALPEPKLAWLSSDLACHPAAQSAVVGHPDSGQYGEEARIHPNFSHLFSEQARPPLLLPHPSAPSYLTQLIETLNAEIKSCTIHPFYE